jgi:hypothetical protein
MKATCAFMGSEGRLNIELSPESDFERTLIEKLSNYLPFTQPCCLEKHLLLATDIFLKEAK